MNTRTPSPASRWKDLAAQMLLVILVSIIVVGARPLQGPQMDGMGSDGGGNMMRQIPLLLVMGLSLLYLIGNRGYRALADVPIPFWIFFLWALLSLTWSETPDIGLRRFIVTLGVTVSVCILTRQIGREKSMKLVGMLVLAFVVVDLLAVLTLRNAIHLPGESDGNLVGLWKGVHSHKNQASTVAFFGVLLGMMEFGHRRSLYSAALFILSAVLLYGSGSKTGLALIAPCMLIALIVWLLSRRFGGRVFLRGAIITFFVAFVGLTVFYWNQIYPIITDGPFMTGRGYIWRISLGYAADSPLGAGFGSFWDAGYNSPAYQYGPALFASAPHGHNGYFDILATTGWLGLPLALFACMAWPIYKLLTDIRKPDQYFVFSIAYLVYFYIHNFAEPSIFMGTRPGWIFFMLVICYFQSRSASTGFPQRARRPLLPNEYYSEIGRAHV